MLMVIMLRPFHKKFIRCDSLCPCQKLQRHVEACPCLVFSYDSLSKTRWIKSIFSHLKWFSWTLTTILETRWRKHMLRLLESFTLFPYIWNPFQNTFFHSWTISSFSVLKSSCSSKLFNLSITSISQRLVHLNIRGNFIWKMSSSFA